MEPILCNHRKTRFDSVASNPTVKWASVEDRSGAIYCIYIQQYIIYIYIFIYLPNTFYGYQRNQISPPQKMTFPTFCSEQFIPNTWNPILRNSHFCHNPPRYISVSPSFFHYVPSHMNFTALNRCIHIYVPPKELVQVFQCLLEVALHRLIVSKLR